MLYVFIVIEGLLLNKRNLATRLDDVSSLYKPTQKHYVYNMLSIYTKYINLIYISLIKYISKINSPNNNSKIEFVEVSLMLYITIISILLIIISNCSLLNPGLDSIIAYYQNTHGLLAFSSLGKDNPTPNLTKVIEFQLYLTVNYPDIVILNETWLKSNIFLQ